MPRPVLGSGRSEPAARLGAEGLPPPNTEPPLDPLSSRRPEPPRAPESVPNTEAHPLSPVPV
jgi:hypothetical protein